MHRNLALLLAALAILAALLVGVNYGKRLNPTAQPLPSPTPVPTESVTPVKTLKYEDKACGITFAYPDNLTKVVSASGGAVFIDPQDQNQSVVVACQEQIPRPALPADKIEIIVLEDSEGATFAAKLYRDTSPKDGSLLDELIFRHPGNGLDIFVAGLGKVFKEVILASLQII